MVGRVSFCWYLMSMTMAKTNTQKQHRNSPQSTVSVTKAKLDDWPSNSRARLMVMKTVRQIFMKYFTFMQGGVYSYSESSACSVAIACEIETSLISTAIMISFFFLIFLVFLSSFCLMCSSSPSNSIYASWLFSSTSSSSSSSSLRMITP